MLVADALTELLAPTVQGLGYELLGIERSSGNGGALVRLYIDSEDGIGIEDCERVSRQVSDWLDVEDAIHGEYTLEVSSPGLDRPLFKREHYEAHVGADVKLRLKRAIDGRRRVAGRLAGTTDETVTIEMGEESIVVPYGDVERARLDPRWE